MKMVMFVSSVSTISIMYGHFLIRPVFHTLVRWKIVKNVRLILRNVKNAWRTLSVIFPVEGVESLPLSIVSAWARMVRLLNV